MKWSKDQNKKTPMWTGKILTNNDPLNEQTRTKKMTCIWKKKKKKKKEQYPAFIYRKCIVIDSKGQIYMEKKERTQ